MKSLLGYLLVRGGRPQSREVLAELLWPTDRPNTSRRKLSHLLYRCRQMVGEEWLEADRGHVGLAAPDTLDVDVWAFDALCDAGSTEALERAVRLYTEDLLPDVYDDWIVPERERLRRRFMAALLELARQAADTGDHAAALHLFQRLTDVDELFEAGHLGLLSTLEALGRPVDGLAACQRWADRLATEMGVAPSAEAQEFEGRFRAALRARSDEGPAASTVPFVGRAKERSRLVERLDAAETGQPGLAVVLGEAGIGKTRLLEELAVSAEWRGWTVTVGAAEEFDVSGAYAPLRRALASALTTARIEQLGHLLPPINLSLAARVVPRIGEVLDLPEPRVPPGETLAVARALGDVIRGLATIRPLLLLLDDLHWADKDTWTALDAIQRSLGGAPVMIVVAARTERLRAAPGAWSAVGRWDAAGVPVIGLTGLDRTSLRSVAEACASDTLSDADLDLLVERTGGNPLLAILGSRGGSRQVGHNRAETSASLAEDRMAQLSADAGMAVRSAAVLGRRFGYREWAAATPEVVPSAMPAAAGELERVGLLRAGERHYRFPHDGLRVAVYEGMSSDERRSRHAVVLGALESSDSADTWRLLHHAREAQFIDRIGPLALDAGSEALASFALQTAVALFTEAIEHLSGDVPLQCQALIGRARAWDKLGDREAEARDIQALSRAVKQVQTWRLEVEVARLKAGHLARTGQLEAAAETARHALRVLEGHPAAIEEDGASSSGVTDQQPTVVEFESALLETLALVARDRGDLAAAERWILQALERCRVGGFTFGAASAMDKLAHLRWGRGQFAEAADMHAEAAEIFAAEGAAFHEATARSGVAVARRKLGDYQAAREGHESVLARARELGMPVLEWSQMVTLGNIGTELGDYDDAVDWYAQALAVCRRQNDPRGESLTLNNLAEAYRDKGSIDGAVRIYQQALDLNRERGFQRGEAYNLMGRGRAYLDAGDLDGAEADLRAASDLWKSLDLHLQLAESLASLVVTLVEAGRPEDACSASAQALTQLDGSDNPGTWQWAHYAAARLADALGDAKSRDAHLAHAQAAMLNTARRLPDHDRDRFLEHVPNNRRLIAMTGPMEQRVPCRLARIGAHLGRSLAPEDYVVVIWTVRSVEDLVIVDQVDRRRSVLRRLLDEAARQGGEPTDDDLAQALCVSRRTILRDTKALRAAGVDVATRGRR